MHCPTPVPVPSAVEELQVVLAHVLQSQESQRRQFARQLHDDLGQVLAILKLQLAALARQFGTAVPRLEDCLELVQRAANQTRTLAMEARPALLDDLGLVPALRWLLQTRTDRTGLTAMVTAEPESPLVPAEWRSTCFRVAEEAIDNALRHAQAKSLTVEVRQHGDVLDMTIRDDGLGFHVADRAGGGGLLTMRARVRLAGGDFALHSQPGAGTEVRVRLVGG